MQVYGFQGTKTGTSSECIVGRFAKRTKLAPKRAPLVIGTKFFTVPWTNFLVGGGFRLGKQSLLDALRASLKRLQMDKVPLYQVGWHGMAWHGIALHCIAIHHSTDTLPLLILQHWHLKMMSPLEMCAK